MNEAEIRSGLSSSSLSATVWSKNEAQLEPGRNVDIKNRSAHRSSFLTSFGDNITPPQQALNWIIDTYSDVREIQIRGQRIVYIVHDQVGHLGIFVSSKIAKKEHTEVTSTLKTIEALPPGLYEMKIDSQAEEAGRPHFTVSFHERSFDDIRALDDGREDEVAFAAVARASELQASAYETCVRPALQASITPQAAEIGRTLHPLRLQRALFSSKNPLLAPLAAAGAKATADPPAAIAPENPFLAAERLWADMVEQWFDLGRDMRDAWYEMTFFSLRGGPWARAFGRPNQVRRTLKNDVELRMLPEVQAALRDLSRGGFAEALVRMLILLAESRGNVRRDRLERSARLLTQAEPFQSMTADQRKMLIHEQTLIAQFEPERAIETLPDMLATRKERELASRAVRYVVGAIDEMAPHTIETLQRFHRVLKLPPVTEDVTGDPISDMRRMRAITRSVTAGEAERAAE